MHDQVMSYWRDYLSAMRVARARIGRGQALSRSEVSKLLSLMEQAQSQNPDHERAIGRVLSDSKDIQQTWTPRASIDAKQKSGDQEQLGIIWAARKCVCGDGVEVDSEAFLRGRKAFEHGMLGELAANRSDSVVLAVREQLQALAEQLQGKGLNQFIVNLTLFDFRTAGRGRARKIANWLRSTNSPASLNAYLRPFEDRLPPVIEELLQECPGTLALSSTTETISFTSEPLKCVAYVPPTRFTASFPLALRGSPGDPPVLVDPRLSDEGPPLSGNLKYAFMGSFGFSEASYCTWAAGTKPNDPEYDGTRLSLGAYSLHPEYVDSLLRLIRGMQREQSEAYAKYGSVGLIHVEALSNLAHKHGETLALTWALDMTQVANTLASAAQAKARRCSAAGLADFFELIHDKITRRRVKLHALNELDTMTAFEYIWVQESALWELCFASASCLTLPELRTAIEDELGPWGCSVGASESSICEVIQNIPTGQSPCSFTRLYGPSGTAAATLLFDNLLALGFGNRGAKSDKALLNTFTSYFEFYLGGFLYEENVLEKATRYPKDHFQAEQVWVNLSDDLHSMLLSDRIPQAEAGSAISAILADHLARNGAAHETSVLVIDMTKFAAEMPNCIIYPMLAQLARCLIESRTTGHVIFVRSNLKYNTGALDRYQSGEVLFVESGPRGLKESLRSDLEKYFAAGSPDVGRPAAKWSLCGEYVSMMKKTYLLADFIGTRRWQEYLTKW